jgi:hypothetical protein
MILDNVPYKMFLLIKNMLTLNIDFTCCQKSP